MLRFIPMVRLPWVTAVTSPAPICLPVVRCEARDCRLHTLISPAAAVVVI